MEEVCDVATEASDIAIDIASPVVEEVVAPIAVEAVGLIFDLF